MWSYVVHGGSPVFFHRAQKFRQSESEKVALQCVMICLSVHSSDIEISDCATKRCLGGARYYGNAFAGELTIRIDTFSPAHALFLNLERRSWFFDEARCIEIPSTLSREQIASGRSSPGRLNVVEDSLPAH